MQTQAFTWQALTRSVHCAAGVLPCMHTLQHGCSTVNTMHVAMCMTHAHASCTCAVATAVVALSAAARLAMHALAGAVVLLWACRRWQRTRAGYDPDLATPDGVNKAVGFLLWAARNFPGWKHSNKAKELVRSCSADHTSALHATAAAGRHVRCTPLDWLLPQGASSTRQVHGALKAAWQKDHLAAHAGRAEEAAKAGTVLADPGLTPSLLSFEQYGAAMQAMKDASLPDKGERPDRDPQVCYRAIQSSMGAVLHATAAAPNRKRGCLLLLHL